MDITLNGQTETLTSEMSLGQLLKEKNLNPQIIAAELNGSIIDRSSYDKALLKEGDVLELLQMMGGG